MSWKWLKMGTDIKLSDKDIKTAFQILEKLNWDMKEWKLYRWPKLGLIDKNYNVWDRWD